MSCTDEGYYKTKYMKLKDAAEFVIETAWGNTGSLSMADQLEAIRMAASILLEEMQTPSVAAHERYLEWKKNPAT